VHHDGRLRHTKSGAAILFGHGDPEPAVVGHGTVEFAWKLAIFVAIEPVLVVELRDHRADAFPDCIEVGPAIVIGCVRLRSHEDCKR
jgi:hypothetical protein